MFLTLCMVLPFITAGVPQIGNMLCPMHIPVMLCGFVLGPQYGAVIGIIAPLMRSVLVGVPPIYPIAAAMAFELCTYGLVSGLTNKLFPKKYGYIYLSLVISMLSGRAVWGAARFIMAGLSGSGFGFEAFIAGAFTSAVPGIILQLALIPPMTVVLRKIKDSIAK